MFVCSQIIFLYTTGIHVVSASTPAEMAGLSLQELFAVSTDDSTKKLSKKNKFKVDLSYKQVLFDGYLKGIDKISNDEILFDGSEQRTDENFPVVPTVIKQEAYIVTLSYIYENSDSISISIPLIRQSTDHISIVPGYDFFTLKSEGLGDIVFNYHRNVNHWNKQQLKIFVGLSIPSGSINTVGDTPRASGNQQLPYTMQLGSGTWDIPAGVSYHNNQSPLYRWGGNFFSKTHVGKNNRDYRLGNRVALSSWIKWRTKDTFQPIVKLVYQNWAHIVGQDDEITVPGAFPYPAPITNPNFYGGKKLNMSLGVDMIVSDETGLSFEFSAPIYQSLNGIQSKEVYNVSLNLSLTF